MSLRPSMPSVLSFIAGYVDTAGFLALHGLFTAHVTGNFVTFGAALVLGTSGIITKLLALPVFCVVVIFTSLLSSFLRAKALPILQMLLGLEALFLAAGGVCAIWFGPFPAFDTISGIITGMLLVSGMAIQNAAHRVHLASAPPSTLMTGTTTQIMLDIAEMLHGAPADQKPLIRARLGKMSRSVLTFAMGCGGGALFYALGHEWCFVLPPLLCLVT